MFRSEQFVNMVIGVYLFIGRHWMSIADNFELFKMPIISLVIYHVFAWKSVWIHLLILSSVLSCFGKAIKKNPCKPSSNATLTSVSQYLFTTLLELSSKISLVPIGTLIIHSISSLVNSTSVIWWGNLIHFRSQIKNL